MHTSWTDNATPDHSTVCIIDHTDKCRPAEGLQRGASRLSKALDSHWISTAVYTTKKMQMRCDRVQAKKETLRVRTEESTTGL